MIIDFHTHVFPEKIAEKTIAHLADVAKIKPAINGLASSLITSMKNAEVDISIVLPVVTNVKQFDSIIRFASELNETYQSEKNRIISFAGIHPDDPDLKSHLNIIKNEGFKGIKIHPPYQEMEFNDKRIKNLLYLTSELDIPVITHAGLDPLDMVHNYCSPEMIFEVLEDVSPKNLILAHLGSNFNYEQSLEKLCGLDVYFDTAAALSRMDISLFKKIVEKHGADKILFATDCPWGHQDEYVNILKSCNISNAAKEKILGENAAKLLNI